MSWFRCALNLDCILSGAAARRRAYNLSCLHSLTCGQSPRKGPHHAHIYTPYSSLFHPSDFITMLSFPSLAELTLTRLSVYSLVALTAYSFLSRVLKFLWVQSVFLHIPGPPSQSWITGDLLLVYMLLDDAKGESAGNLGQLFNSKGLPFHHHLSERYGGIVKIHGFFGVRNVCQYTPVLEGTSKSRLG